MQKDADTPGMQHGRATSAKCRPRCDNCWGAQFVFNLHFADEDWDGVTTGDGYTDSCREVHLQAQMVVMKGCERSVAKRTRLQHSSEFACKQQGVRAGEKVRWGREKKYPRFERSQAGIRILKMPMRELLHVLQ
jgi:hypothetical protein